MLDFVNNVIYFKTRKILFYISIKKDQQIIKCYKRLKKYLLFYFISTKMYLKT